LSYASWHLSANLAQHVYNRWVDTTERRRDPQVLFVYGLLMRGFELNALLADGELVDEATIPGVLISLGTYPGLLEGDGTVRGELYAFKDLDQALTRIDAAEEYDPHNEKQSLYRRVARDVQGAKLGRVLAWVYLYNGSAKDAPLLPRGDWRRVE
jgi:gamma-glutamylcyclotransferase (GGCT)/AIG2-like uncharacterized protein YtfP